MQWRKDLIKTCYVERTIPLKRRKVHSKRSPLFNLFDLLHVIIYHSSNGEPKIREDPKRFLLGKELEKKAHSVN